MRNEAIVSLMMHLSSIADKKTLVTDLRDACNAYLENPTKETEANLDFRNMMLGMNHATGGDIRNAGEVIAEMTEVQKIKSMLSKENMS